MSGFSTVFFDNKVWIFGGSDGYPLRKVFALDLNEMKWIEKAEMKFRRDKLTSVLGSDGNIYCIGGNTSN